jgi:hypothetical protein
MSLVAGSLNHAMFLDQASPKEAQDLALQHQRDVQVLLQRVRDKVYELGPLLDAYVELQHAINGLSLARPKVIRCPYQTVKTTVELVQLAHDPAVKTAKVV